MTKKIQRPRKVKVKEGEYKIAYRSKAWGKKKKIYGQIQYDRKLIEIEDHGKDNKELVDTCWHELCHLLIHEFNLPVDGRKEEALVTQFTNALIEVLAANPKFLEWTAKKLNPQI